jgi:hypothetical protein
MDTVKRQLFKGREMRVHVGDIGPLPGVQALEWTPSLSIERNGEYDSDEQILTLGIPEYSGALDILDNERMDFYRALTGKSLANLTDFVIDNVGEAPIMLNVWADKSKKRFGRSALVIRPTWTSLPYPTSLEEVTRIRSEFSAVRCVRFPQHACAFNTYAIGGSPGAGDQYNFSTKVPVKLSRRFGGHYVACVVNKVEDTNSAGDFDYRYMCVNTSSTSFFTLTEAPAANSTLLAYFAYVSTAEAGGYVCSTV